MLLLNCGLKWGTAAKLVKYDHRISNFGFVVVRAPTLHPVSFSLDSFIIIASFHFILFNVFPFISASFWQHSICLDVTNTIIDNFFYS